MSVSYTHLAFHLLPLCSNGPELRIRLGASLLVTQFSRLVIEVGGVLGLLEDGASDIPSNIASCLCCPRGDLISLGGRDAT